MKKIFGSKKNLIIIGIILVLLITSIIVVISLSKKDKDVEDKKLVENTYTMYVKINPLVKLHFKETYYTCNGKVCSEYGTKVIDTIWLNEDAKRVYGKINLVDKDLYDGVKLLIDTYLDKENKEKLDEIILTTDWKNYKDSGLEEKINNVVTDVVINFKETIDEKEILSNEVVKTYIVKFDSDGGTDVPNQEVVENDKVKEPTDVKKDGYTFVEWQFDGKKYDFNSQITSDITLKAIWSKNEEVNDSPNMEENVPDNNENPYNSDETNNPSNIEENTPVEDETHYDPEEDCHVTPESDIPMVYRFECGKTGQEAYDEMMALKATVFSPMISKVNDGSGHAQQINAGYHLISSKYNYRYSVGIYVDIILIDPVDKVSSFGYLKEDGTVEWIYFREAR